MRINLRDKLTFNWVNRDGKLIMLSRGLCTFAQSAIAILIALYLEKLGFNLTQVGAFLSAGVAGSAFFAFIVSLTSEKIGRKRLLIVFTLLPVATGLALVFIDDFLPLMFFAFVGSIAVRGGMGPVQPLEQACLSPFPFLLMIPLLWARCETSSFGRNKPLRLLNEPRGKYRQGCLEGGFAVEFEARRGVRVAYGDGPENRCRRKTTVGSNPTPSATNETQ